MNKLMLRLCVAVVDAVVVAVRRSGFFPVAVTDAV